MAGYQPISPTKKFNTATFLTLAVLISILLATMLSFPAFADAPANGTVIEGESVPGLALGATRAQVEAAYGGPVHSSR